MEDELEYGNIRDKGEQQKCLIENTILCEPKSFGYSEILLFSLWLGWIVVDIVEAIYFT